MHRYDNWKVKWYKRNAGNTAWEEAVSLPAWTAADDTAYPNQIDVDSGSDIDLWLGSYTGFSGTNPRSGHGEYMLYHYNGSSWARQEVYLGSTHTLSEPDATALGGTWVQNGQSALDRVLLGVSGPITGTYGSIWGWGSNGFVKSATGNASYSPVGRGWLFYSSNKDSFGVQHLAYSGSSNFTFSTNKISLEALVRFETLSDTGQQIVNKSVVGSPIGFGIWQINRDGTGRIEWVMTNGTNYYTVQSTVAINTGTWYYVVATFDDAANEQALWVNGTETSNTNATFTSSWGTADLRYGTVPSVGGWFLNGYLGGYASIRDGVPSDAYIRASDKNFIDGTFVTYGSKETRPDSCYQPTHYNIHSVFHKSSGYPSEP